MIEAEFFSTALATPTECVPFLAIAVSSITSTASLPPRYHQRSIRRHAQVGFQESLDGQEGLTSITCQAVPGQRAGTLRREIGNK
jgi:hypothetical protein